MVVNVRVRAVGCPQCNVMCKVDALRNEDGKLKCDECGSILAWTSEHEAVKWDDKYKRDIKFA